MIQYSILPNKLKGQTGKYKAVITKSRTWDFEDVLEEMERRRSSISRPDAVAALHLFFEVIESILIDGGSINTPLFRMLLSIKGNFKDLDDRFYRKRHKIEVNISPGKKLKKIVKDIKTQKTTGYTHYPKLRTLKNYTPDVPEDVITPGGIAEISGYYLKIDMKDPDQGLFLQSASETIRIQTIVINQVSKLTFGFPLNLPSGAYKLIVKAKPGNCTQLREGALNMDLVVK